MQKNKVFVAKPLFRYFRYRRNQLVCCITL